MRVKEFHLAAFFEAEERKADLSQKLAEVTGKYDRANAQLCQQRKLWRKGLREFDAELFEEFCNHLSNLADEINLLETAYLQVGDSPCPF